MAHLDHLVEQHILQHNAQLKNIDEFLDRVEKVDLSKKEMSDLARELEELKNEREKLLAHIGELKQKTREEWQEDDFNQVGPMVIWEAVAKRLQRLVERLEN